MYTAIDAIKILFDYLPPLTQQIKVVEVPQSLTTPLSTVYLGSASSGRSIPKAGQMYNKEWKSWRRSLSDRKLAEMEPRRILWTKCCVCQKTTRANLPWYKRVIFIRSPYDTKTTFKPFVVGRWATWGVCSDECLNMFYLGNEE